MKTRWAVLGTFVLAAGFDYGKHWTLKHILEKEFNTLGSPMTVETLTVSPWPLFQASVVLKNFHLQAANASLAGLLAFPVSLSCEQVYLRQGWTDWHWAHIKAFRLQMPDFVSVKQAAGSLEITTLDRRVNVKDLILSDLKINAPLMPLSSPTASSDFLYDIATHCLSLKVDAPAIYFPDGIHFGFSGKGNFYTFPLLKGQMSLKVKNIHQLLKQLADNKVIDASESNMLMGGSRLLDSLGIQDMTLPLKIEEGTVYLGPLALMKIYPSAIPSQPAEAGT